MLAFLSSPIRRWIFATLLLPVIAVLLSAIGRYLQRRNGGAPTRSSRVLLSVASVARRRSHTNHDESDLISTPRPYGAHSAENVTAEPPPRT